MGAEFTSQCDVRIASSRARLFCAPKFSSARCIPSSDALIEVAASVMP